MFRSRIAWGLGFISCERGGREGRGRALGLLVWVAVRSRREEQVGWKRGLSRWNIMVGAPRICF